METETGVCLNCGDGPLYSKKGIPSAGLLGPNLLPGLDIMAASFDAIACGNCAFVQFFISKSYRKGLAKSWNRISRDAG
jgi:predicted nucleic-acid-binding Zn-ribbon protein